MREKNQRNSRKRLNALILLVAFTAILLIVSTYAWFSSQKNITIGGLYGEVNVAEGLRMSLDGSHWVNSLKFSDFNQETDGAWTDKTAQYLDTGKTFQNPAEGVTNFTTTEYLPVSTAGLAADATTFLQMYNGVNENTKEIKSIAKVTEEEDAGFFAFDLFLMNTTDGSIDDELLLDAYSKVAADNQNTGIENTVRVAFALYDNSSDAVTTAGELDGATVIAETSTGKSIENVSIWEPNSNAHTETVTQTINPFISFSDSDKTTWSLTTADGFETTEAIPTYAFTSTAVGTTMTNIYDWKTLATGLSLQKTFQTKTDFNTEATSTNIKKVDGNNLTIGANQYHKIRIYVWIEGQDPDCINAASFGGGLTLDLGFSKPGSTTE